MKSLNIYIFIIAFLLFSECYIKKSVRKKNTNFPNVKLLNYLEHPRCKKIAETWNNNQHNEYYGDVDTWMKIISDPNILDITLNALVDYYTAEETGNNPQDLEIYYTDVNNKNITMHFSTFPKLLQTELVKCYYKSNSGTFDNNFNRKECIELNDEQLKIMFAEIIISSENLFKYNKDLLSNEIKYISKHPCHAIINYTKSGTNVLIGYEAINCLLISDIGNNLPKYFISDLNISIEKLKLSYENEDCGSIPKNGRILYRGQYYKNIVKVGDVLANLGYLSTSYDENIAYRFASGYNPDERVIFIFKNTNFNDNNSVKIIGKDISRTSSFEKEKEILLSPKQCFKILSINIDNFARKIELEAIDCIQVKEAISF